MCFLPPAVCSVHSLHKTRRMSSDRCARDRASRGLTKDIAKDRAIGIGYGHKPHRPVVVWDSAQAELILHVLRVRAARRRLHLWCGHRTPTTSTFSSAMESCTWLEGWFTLVTGPNIQRCASLLRPRDPQQPGQRSDTAPAELSRWR